MDLARRLLAGRNYRHNRRVSLPLQAGHGALMATKPIPLDKQKAIVRLAKRGLSDRVIGRQLDIHHTTVLNYRQTGVKPEVKIGPENIEEGLRSTLRREPMSARDLASQLGIKVTEVRRRIVDLQRRGVLIVEHPGGMFDLASTVNIPPRNLRDQSQARSGAHLRRYNRQPSVQQIRASRCAQCRLRSLRAHRR